MFMRYAFRHRDGCGEIAFYYEKRPIAGSIINVKDCLMPDGTSPIDQTLVRCGACHLPIDHFSRHDIEEVPEIQIFKASSGTNQAPP